MKSQLSQLSFDSATHETTLQAIQSQINKFSSYLSLTETFNDQLNKSLTSALFYIHDTYPQLLHELKVADAKGAELGLLLEGSNKKSTNTALPPEVLEKNISAKAQEIIQQLNFTDEKNLKTIFLNEFTSKETKLLFDGTLRSPNISHKLQMQDLIKIFETYLSKSTDLTIPFDRYIHTCKIAQHIYPVKGGDYFVMEYLGNSLFQNKLLIPTFLLFAMSANNSKDTALLVTYFKQRLQEMHDNYELELKSHKSTDGLFYFFNSEKREQHSQLQKKVRDLKKALKVFAIETSNIQSTLSLLKTQSNSFILLDNLMININFGDSGL